MKHFIGFVVSIFLVLLLLYAYKDDGQIISDYSSLKVYGSSSFIGSWGPGPKLKEIFEKQNGVKVTFLEMTEPSLLFQKMAFEGQQAVGDVIVSLDQYDLSRAGDKLKWKKLSSKITPQFPHDPKVIENLNQFIAYDWAPIAFVVRDDLGIEVNSLDDLLKPELKGRIALEDPRTSSPGLNFLAWVNRSKGEGEAEAYLKKLIDQAHSFAPSWSAAYGLFKTKQVDIVLSYSTSPIYHLVEEKNSHYRALEFKEGHPIQVEFAGVPESCQNCDAAIKFVQFLHSPEAQKIIMQKNYMLPVMKSAQEGTEFDAIKIFKTIPFVLEPKEQLQKWIGVWAELRKNEG